MTLDQWASIAEIIAAIAVVASLIYLAVQLRQNTTAVMLNTAHSVTDELQQTFSLLASDESLAEVFALAATEPELSGVTRVRFNTFVSNLMRVYENASTSGISSWHSISIYSMDCSWSIRSLFIWQRKERWTPNCATR